MLSGSVRSNSNCAKAGDIEGDLRQFRFDNVDDRHLDRVAYCELVEDVRVVPREVGDDEVALLHRSKDLGGDHSGLVDLVTPSDFVFLGEGLPEDVLENLVRPLPDFGVLAADRRDYEASWFSSFRHGREAIVNGSTATAQFTAQPLPTEKLNSLLACVGTTVTR
jgi:hypothetical protein